MRAISAIAIAVSLLFGLFALSIPASALRVYVNPSVQTGNYSPDGAYQEGSNMQDVASRLMSKLQARGFEAKNSGWMDLGSACADSNAWGANCFVALHTDATGAGGWVSNHGTRGFYYESSGGWHDARCVDFAQHIVNKMVEKFNAFGRGYNLGTQADYPWLGWNMYVIAPWNTSAMPATLIEGLYHDNWNDVYNVLLTTAGRDAYAQGVFEGICDYYGLSYSSATPELYIEPRGQNSNYYSDDGDANWGNSAGWCNSFDSHLTSGGSRYYPASNATPSGRWVRLQPSLRVPGGTYQVDVAHYDNSLVSTDIVTSTALTNCSATFGDLKNGSTSAFQQGYGCQWFNLGTIVLNAGQTQPTVRFTYSSGNVNDSSHRWNVEAFRFGLVPTASTLTLNVSSGGTVGGGGSKTSGNSVTATANPNTGYRFVNWTTGGFGGTVVSTSAAYTFVMPAQGYTLYANFALIGTLVTTVGCPPAGGTLTGGGSYNPGQSVTVTATAATGYSFVNWTSGGCGGTQVSANSSYAFTVGSSDVTLYANFILHNHTLTAIANPGSRGSVSGDSGTRSFGASCTVTATPNSGQYFGGWSTDDEGTNIVSTSATYTFSMPDTAYTLYANFFAQPIVRFTEDFESRATGDLDMNHTTPSNGPNYSVNGNKSGNPWFGNCPPDISALAATGGVTPHGGTKMAGVESGYWGAGTAINLAYRLNNSNPLPGNVYLDWWFYDPKGSASDAQLYMDYVALCNYASPVLPASGNTLDFGTFAKCASAFYSPGPAQELALGAGRDQLGAFDKTKYQIRVIGDTSGYDGGWSNTSAARTVGWHHARIVVGAVQGNGTNDVSFYIDDMATPLATRNSTTAIGYNSILMRMKPTTSNVTGYVDDITIASAPSVVSVSVSPSQYVNTSPVTATWSGVGAASYMLKVDDGSWAVATSPYAIDTTGLGYGLHTVYVKGVDSGGNDGPAAAATFTVDRSSIRNWAVIGFYPWGSSSSDPAPGRFANNFFSPDKTEPLALAKNGMTYGGKQWFTYSSPSPIVDFDAVYGTNKTYGVSYVFTYVTNHGDGIPGARVTCGSDDGIKVIYNGATVLSNDTSRGLTMDSDLSSPFVIYPGTSRLLIKTTQGSGGEAVQARFCNADRSEPAWLSQLTFATSDDTGPTGSVEINGGSGYTTDPNVALALSATDDLCGVWKMSFSNDNVTWTTPETFLETKSWALTSGAGLRTVYVKYTDYLGNVSPAFSSQIVLGPAPTELARISDLWALVNGLVYSFTNKTVSATWTDGFWIEETDRSAGLKVLYSGPTVVAAGDLVDVIGVTSTDAQRVLTASYVDDHGPADLAIAPLGVIEQYVGGTGVNSDTPAMTGGRGMYSIGLLVKIAGVVGSPGSNSFYIDDGSGLVDAGANGIKVYCSGTPPSSGSRVVTGVVGVEAGKPVLYATNIQIP